jgi:acyl-[acyl-carrier-protein] desaturase
MTPSDEARLAPQIELLQGLGHVVQENIGLLLPPDAAWQPTDYLPDLTRDDWIDQLTEFRSRAQQISDELLVVLVGDMVTEEALPNYAISLNLISRDYQGTCAKPWSRWMRGWTAEENRHGDLLNAYLRLTGRVNMRSVELTVHNLISDGFNPRAYPDLYAGLVYTSFQERATKISHARVGALAAECGEENLARICKKIAGDESRHESFYTRMMAEVVQHDPVRSVMIMRDMMKRMITMPGERMYDGADRNLFAHFATVAQRTGVYTVHDYAGIFRHLIATWGIAKLSLSDSAAKAQEFLCRQADRIESLAERAAEELALEPAVKFSWIQNRMV